jgi:hypothetical protein
MVTLCINHMNLELKPETPFHWSGHCPHCLEPNLSEVQQGLMTLLMEGATLTTEELIILQYSDDDRTKQSGTLRASLVFHEECLIQAMIPRLRFLEVLNWSEFPWVLL